MFRGWIHHEDGAEKFWNPNGVGPIEPKSDPCHRRNRGFLRSTSQTARSCTD